MQIGVPREVKQDEYRVGMIPAGVEELTRAGHRVVIETGAGLGSGITDEHYTEAGAQIAASAAVVYGQADLIVKVKEPQAKEWPLLRSGQMVFTYFHFAASEDLTRNVLATGSTAIAYEANSASIGFIRTTLVATRPNIAAARLSASGDVPLMICGIRCIS